MHMYFFNATPKLNYFLCLDIIHNCVYFTEQGGGFYLAECAVQRFVLSHELIEENLKGVDPHCDRRLSPVPLLLSHGLLQDVLKQSVEVFVADTLTVVHLGRKTMGSQGEHSLCLPTLEIMFQKKKI